MLKSFKTAAIALITVIASPLSLAHDYEAGNIHIDHPWSREAPPNAPVIGGFFQLTNHGDSEDALIAAESPIAGHVEIHTHKKEDGVMKMIKIDEVRVPANDSVLFKPGSFHLMIFNPTQALKEGDRFPMTLTFKNAGKVEVEMAVEKQGHMEKHMHH
ncbi:copper chaperone PCu(A)C [Vibrio diabolicus]|uniref:copper chaperone PCu(A)C n=1 Tax=Vibrio TaxID=662 RepID=UPI0013DFF427|nr:MULTISPECIES: copper chaperone PCu(A)C [Vibrio]MCR9673274.1 copper chaperone PCu(A)C [Vibrio alginolyticus]MCE9845417.1 copper chaperone PCu(A)C [Vibrio antiquarius]MCS0207255.1 copper chaperone PCu(A)C [Vibrio sp. HS-50-1]MCS0399238.1 copper chaperone PCu(A)C [Vibrio diabolicus]QOV32242.1 copper chaperone PCu(A)C [Vibrio diabolicus]